MDENFILMIEEIIRLKKMDISASELIEFWENIISRLSSSSQYLEEPHEQESLQQDHRED
jgi:hypothetical protein